MNRLTDSFLAFGWVGANKVQRGRRVSFGFEIVTFTIVTGRSLIRFIESVRLFV